MKRLFFILIFLSLSFPASKADAMVFISEILADPPAGLAGDADGNGVRSSSGDEFVELYNKSDSTVDLTGWYLNDATGLRHVFSHTLQPQEYYPVFGSSASTGSLGLNNTGDIVSLFDEEGILRDRVVYGSIGNEDQSIVREGNALFLHTQISPYAYSPGQPNRPATVPQPATFFLFLLGLSFCARFRPS